MIVVQAPVGGLSGQVTFRDWSSRQYAGLLAQFTQMPVDSVYDAATDRAMTWLRKADGSLNIGGPESSKVTTVEGGERRSSRGAVRQRPVSAPRRAGRRR